MAGAASSAARFLAGLGGLASLVLIAAPAAAQADPEPRAYAEVGTELPLKGNAPINGYAFFLWNRPNFPNEDQYLRIVVAPTYLLSELVQDHWPFGRHAVSIGLWGGGIRYGHEEYRHGSHQAEESFWGHGAELPLSYYANTKLFDKLPLQGQIRVTPSFVVYQDSFSTADDFELPPDTGLFMGRVGLRLGGKPPELLPELALEASAWYEATFRTETGTFGLPGQTEELESLTQKAWGRLAGVFKPVDGHTVDVLVTAGLTRGTDLLSSFRLGSALPFRSEFPLILHGYFVEEVFAKRFWLVNASYRFPAWPGSRNVHLRVSFDIAGVDYVAGHQLPRDVLRGVGGDISVALTSRATVVFGYGYGIDAPRNGGFGGHEAHALVEWKF
ncbi:MAG: hypothetical protein ACREJR_06295 [Candidatus Rokuibacteriota bacterium]